MWDSHSSRDPDVMSEAAEKNGIDMFIPPGVYPPAQRRSRNLEQSELQPGSVQAHSRGVGSDNCELHAGAPIK